MPPRHLRRFLLIALCVAVVASGGGASPARAGGHEDTVTRASHGLLAQLDAATPVTTPSEPPAEDSAETPAHAFTPETSDPARSEPDPSAESSAETPPVTSPVTPSVTPATTPSEPPAEDSVETPAHAFTPETSDPARSELDPSAETPPFPKPSQALQQPALLPALPTASDSVPPREDNATDPAERVDSLEQALTAQEPEEEPIKEPEHPIPGAFGFRLGQLYTPDEGAEFVEERQGLVRVEVEPLQSNPHLRFHSLWLDPEDQTVAQIVGVGPQEDERAAELALARLRDALERKYGPMTYEDLAYSIHKEGRSIHLGASLQGDVWVVAVIYQDDALTAQALERAARQRYGLTTTPRARDDAGL